MHRTYRALYRLGITPWEDPAIPAALAATIDAVAGEPGRAVDFGCGTGRQALYLAARGWEVTAVDYVPEAIAAARERDPDGLVTWRLADVTEPRAVDPDGRLAGTVKFLLDNGCLHGVPDHRRPGWALTVQALAAPGSVLLVRAAPRGHRAIGPRGIDPGDITALLGETWRPEAPPGPGWYRYTSDQPGRPGLL